MLGILEPFLNYERVALLWSYAPHRALLDPRGVCRITALFPGIVGGPMGTELMLPWPGLDLSRFRIAVKIFLGVSECPQLMIP